MSVSEAARPLVGARILVVEDELVIALELAMTLGEAGAIVIGPCATLSQAWQAVRSEAFDLAVLDVRLGRETSAPVARFLADRGTPIVFYSGQVLSAELRDACPAAVLVEKPAAESELIQTVARLLPG